MSAKNKTISQKIAELDEIVAWFDQEDIDIEQAITKFEQGSKLADDIGKHLEVMENKITVLKERFDAK